MKRTQTHTPLDAVQAIQLYWQNGATLNDVADALKDTDYTRHTKPVIHAALKAITRFKADPHALPDLLTALDNVVSTLQGGER